MEGLEITAGTLEEAMEEAEQQLGISRERLETEVIKDGKPGIFGMGGGKVVIRVKPSSHPEQNVAEVATEVLEKLLDLMGVVGVVETSSSGVPVALNIEGDDLGILIGRRGQTLSCLQYIVRLMTAGRLKAWFPLNIDVCGYKERRYVSLQKLALRLAEQVKLRHRDITLEPMPPDERRMIHLTLTDYPDIATHSIGEGEDRKVVISLKRG
ncbi:MAG: RNA-binding cell elongation regulator Jag/EloR [Chloroflexota bacterium]|nr:RNA-binding cell elongation regulator Jag/EloR [Chloroflexota bacterium]